VLQLVLADRRDGFLDAARHGVEEGGHRPVDGTIERIEIDGAALQHFLGFVLRFSR